MAETNTQVQATTGSALTKEDHASLVNRLDELYEEYLGLLDEYTKSREQLSQSLSKGFISLAQANFTSPNRTRYGQDYYDDRMQAAKTIRVASDMSFHVDAQAASSSKLPNVVANEQINDPTDGEPGEPEKGSENPSGTEEKDASQQEDKVETAVDPLKWFGVLVPPALRTAQGCFTDVVMGSIAQVVNADKEMERIEIEIRRTKKRMAKLGL